MTIAETIDRSSLFQHVSEELRQVLATAAERLVVDDGTLVVRTGEPGDAAYLIEDGMVEVFADQPDGPPVVLAQLKAGHHFGEQALLGAERRRMASIRSLGQSVLVRIPRKAFTDAVGSDAGTVARLELIGREQSHRNFARQSNLFRHLALEQFDQLRFEAAHYDAGETVFEQGDPADRVHLIIAGKASIYKQIDGTPTMIASLLPGECFGELAVIQGGTRQATVVAEGPLETQTLTADAFTRLVGGSELLRRYLSALDRIYQLPRRGLVTQGRGRLNDKDAITCIYQLPKGDTVVAARTADGTAFAMRRGGDQDPVVSFSYRNEASDLSVDLGFAHHRLVSVTVTGDWRDLSAACELLLQGEILPPWSEAIFVTRGRLPVADAEQDKNLVCPCLAITVPDLRRLAAEARPGLDTDGDLSAGLASAVARTGAGTVCGACNSRIERALARPAA